MAHFTQAQCDASSITREKRLTDGTFKDWVIRIHDENGNYYEYVDESAPENRALDTHKAEIHNYLKANVDHKLAPTNVVTTEAAEVL
tara:strand:- start:2623 stop:2883 length:261 start_codon:yes stop_codon:yes gene_type:complete